MLKEAVVVSLSVVSSSAPAPATATVANAKTSPAKLPRPASLISVDAPPASGPIAHARLVCSPAGVSVQPAGGASKTNGTSPANVAASDAPCAWTCGARFVTVSVQLAGVSRVAGFGVALIVTERSTRPAGTTRSWNCPCTGVGRVAPSETVKRTVWRPTLAPICGVPDKRPAALRLRPGTGTALVSAYVSEAVSVSESVTKDVRSRSNGEFSVAVCSGIVLIAGGLSTSSTVIWY